VEPSELLARVHAERNRDRTVVGQWLAQISDEERARFREFLAAYEANASYKLPLLLAALHADEILGAAGAGFPDISGESLSTWMSRNERASETG
jgi:hypothetical protein